MGDLLVARFPLCEQVKSDAFGFFLRQFHGNYCFQGFRQSKEIPPLLQYQTPFLQGKFTLGLSDPVVVDQDIDLYT